MAYPAKQMFGHPMRGANPEIDAQDKLAPPAAIAAQHEAFEKAMIEAGRETFSGEVQARPDLSFASPGSVQRAPLLQKSSSRRDEISRMTKGLDSATAALVKEQLSKEWTVGNGLTTGTPIGTGLVPYDLEAPILTWVAA